MRVRERCARTVGLGAADAAGSAVGRDVCVGGETSCVSVSGTRAKGRSITERKRVVASITFEPCCCAGR